MAGLLGARKLIGGLVRGLGTPATVVTIRAEFTPRPSAAKPAASAIERTGRKESLPPCSSTFTIPALSSSEKVLVADAAISQGGQNKSAARNNYSFTKIPGGWDGVSGNRGDLHESPHLNGRFPSGGNLVMLDNYGEWRKWNDTRPQTQGGVSGSWC